VLQRQRQIIFSSPDTTEGLALRAGRVLKTQDFLGNSVLLKPIKHSF
jgi:hypothetical protein